MWKEGKENKPASLCVCRFIYPEAVKRMFVLAGLLTCPVLSWAAFPSACCGGQWQKDIAQRTCLSGDSQQRVCSGFPPDSLFIVLFRSERNETKTLQR